MQRLATPPPPPHRIIMTDQLLSSVTGNDDESSAVRVLTSAGSVATMDLVVTKVPAPPPTHPSPLAANNEAADDSCCGGCESYGSDSAAEKPILLELGNAQLSSAGCARDYAYPLDMHAVGPAGAYLLPPQNATQVFNELTLYQHHPYGPSLGGHAQMPLHHLHAPSHVPPPALQLTQHSALASADGGQHCNSMCHVDQAGNHLIPQTVCTWMPPEGGLELVEEKSPEALLVPPTMYMAYTGVTEHSVTKHPNTWKEKAMQIEKDYKKTACDRERTRMRDMNRSFDRLRSKLPISKPNGKKYSKIESLRIAINYIKHLESLRDMPRDSEDMCSSQADAINYAVSTFHYKSRKASFKTSIDTMGKEFDDPSSGGAWSDGGYAPIDQPSQWD